eukprot:490446-Pleurochrysis_carterae.AAC.4
MALPLVYHLATLNAGADACAAVSGETNRRVMETGVIARIAWPTRRFCMPPPSTAFDLASVSFDLQLMQAGSHALHLLLLLLCRSTPIPQTLACTFFVRRTCVARAASWTHAH